ncbi:lytic transglycosylase domain-containing protein [Luteimonas sp. 100069]|uniref:transglycosylase SLT domain-containing protein n=1 Tax=Luteimonas sp. 100069 TaxID=2006109 RepID=UPI0018F4AC43
MELMGCTDLAVPAEVMRHVVGVESSYNPFAIGVVGGRLARQPRTLAEAVSTTRMLEREGYNFSVGLAQVNRHNLARHGLDSHEKAFETCPNLRAGAKILAECHARAGGDWGKALSCYYSGNFVTGFEHGYVQKVLASWRAGTQSPAIPVVSGTVTRSASKESPALASRLARRVQEAQSKGQPSAPEMRLPQEAMPVGEPAAASAPMQATAVQRGDAGDGPVTVQASAPTSAPTAAAGTAVSTPSRDGAFVF